MKETFFKGLDADEERELKEEFLKATQFRKALVRVLERKIENSYEAMSNPDYTNPNWINEQTDRIGHIKALKQTISLIK